MSITLTQLAYQALRDIGVMRPDVGPSTDQLADIRTAANQMIDSFLLDELLVYTIAAQSFSLTAGQQTYTIGPTGANLTASRPTEIEEANIILNTTSPAVRTPLELINDRQWADLRVQQIPYALPLKLYYDGGFDSQGRATIYLWPGPLASYQLELFTWQQLQQFADLTTAYTFPPGYELLLRKKLAAEIAPMMAVHFKIPQPLLDRVERDAREAMQRVQNFNAPNPVQQCDPAFMGRRRGGWNYMLGR